MIGTCSISRSSPQHFREPDSLNTHKFRVISLPISLLGLDSQALEERESLVSNAEMIAKLVVNLHEPQDVDSRPCVREYQSAIVERFGGCTLLSGGVLPFELVERIATTTVGILNAPPDTGPGSVERLRQALTEALSLFARIGESSDVEPPPSQSGETTTPTEPELPPSLTVTSQDTEKSSKEQSLLDGLIKPEDIKTTFDSIHLPQSTVKSIRLLTELALLRPEEFSVSISQITPFPLASKVLSFVAGSPYCLEPRKLLFQIKIHALKYSFLT